MSPEDRVDAIAGDHEPVLVLWDQGGGMFRVETESGERWSVESFRIGPLCSDIEFLPSTWRRMASRAEQIRRRMPCSS
jgi:hypothetical protein